MLGILLTWILGGFAIQPLDYDFNYTEVGQVSAQTIQHRWFASSDKRQAIIQYAYNLWGINFVTMIECENWNRDMYAISKTNDYWICQLNYRYNSDFINSDKFNDVYSQLDYCYEKWKINPKLWNWPTRRIKWKLCKDYVLDRFIITWKN